MEKTDLDTIVSSFRNAYSKGDWYPAFSDAQDYDNRIVTWILNHFNLVDAVVIEVGAGHGRHAKLLSSHCKDYIAFEPSDTLRSLAESSSLNNKESWIKSINGLRVSNHRKHYDAIFSFWADIPVNDYLAICDDLNPALSIVVMNGQNGSFSSFWPAAALDAWKKRQKKLIDCGYSLTTLLTSIRFNTQEEKETVLANLFPDISLGNDNFVDQEIVVAWKYINRKANSYHLLDIYRQSPKDFWEFIQLSTDSSECINFNLSGYCLVNLKFTNCIFYGCDFSDSDLSGTQFINCDLYKCTFKGTILYSTIFTNSKLIRAIFDNAYLYGVVMENVDITLASFNTPMFEVYFRQSDLNSNNKFPKVPLFAKDNPRERSGISYSSNGFSVSYRSYLRGEKKLRQAETFNILKRTHKANGYVEQAASFYYLEMKARARIKWFSAKSILHFTYELTCGYGEKPLRLLVWILVLTCLFGYIYALLPYKSGSDFILIDGQFQYLFPLNVLEFVRYLWISIRTGLIALGIFDAYKCIFFGIAKTISVVHRLITFVFVGLLVPVFIRRIVRD